MDYRGQWHQHGLLDGQDNLLDTILKGDNLNAAYKKVKANKGAGGIDGMQVDELLPYLREHQTEIVRKLTRFERSEPIPGNIWIFSNLP